MPANRHEIYRASCRSSALRTKKSDRDMVVHRRPNHQYAMNASSARTITVLMMRRRPSRLAVSSDEPIRSKALGLASGFHGCGLFLAAWLGAVWVWRGDQLVSRLVDHQQETAESAVVWLDRVPDLVVVLHRDPSQALGAFPGHGGFYAGRRTSGRRSRKRPGCRSSMTSRSGCWRQCARSTGIRPFQMRSLGHLRWPVVTENLFRSRNWTSLGSTTPKAIARAGGVQRAIENRNWGGCCRHSDGRPLGFAPKGRRPLTR
jgi:hypothetical protein